MSTNDLTFREGEPWRITLECTDENGEVLPLLSGANVQFRISDAAGAAYTSEVGTGITITDPEGGVVDIYIPVADQQAALIVSGGVYSYEARTIVGDSILTQSEGRFAIESSLFEGTAENPLLLQFTTRFPEFGDLDDNLVLLYLSDSADIIANNPAWAVDDPNIPLATLYLAAHRLMLKRNAATIYSKTATAGTVGVVSAVRVEDRTVTFDTSTSALTAANKRGLQQTMYGQEYLDMLRRRPHFYEAM